MYRVSLILTCLTKSSDEIRGHYWFTRLVINIAAIKLNVQAE